MAVKIRLRQQGRSNHHTYRLVACNSHVKRDGKYLENLGWYDPQIEKNNAKIHEEKILQWLEKGAVMTEAAEGLIKKIAPSIIKKWNDKKEAKRVKLLAKRKARDNKEVSSKA